MFSKECGKSNKTFLVKRFLLEVFNLKLIIPYGTFSPDDKKTGFEVTDPEGSFYVGLPLV